MNRATPTVFVVDDDPAMCESLQWLLDSEGLRVETHNSAEEFLASYDASRPGCVVLDVRMRGMSGLDLQARLAADGHLIPLIIITGHGDVPTAVRALKAGAVEFLEKPVNDQVLLRHIRSALQLDARRREEQRDQEQVRRRLDSLTAREQEVLELVIAGNSNKQIAAALAITEKTVEAHRKRVMNKMKTHSVADLVRTVVQWRSTRGKPG